MESNVVELNPEYNKFVEFEKIERLEDLPQTKLSNQFIVLEFPNTEKEKCLDVRESELEAYKSLKAVPHKKKAVVKGDIYYCVLLDMPIVMRYEKHEN